MWRVAYKFGWVASIERCQEGTATRCGRTPWRDPLARMGMAELTTIARIAVAQDGVFTLHQAEAAEVDRRIVHRAALDGVVTSIRHGVYRFTATPLSAEREIRAAVYGVGAGARASHESSLRLHQVPNIPFDRPVVSVPPGRRANHSDVRIHRLVDQHPEHLAEIDGVPTTSLPRAIVDVSSVFSRPRMEWLLDEATITKRIVTPGAIARVHRQVNHRGRRHIARLGELLDARTSTGSVPRSTLERKMDEMLALTPLATPARECPVPSLAPGAGFADRAWEDAMLILEVDGRTYHERRIAMRRDRSRDRAAGLLGWHTVRVLDEEVDDEPDLVIADIVGIYERRRSQLRATV